MIKNTTSLCRFKNDLRKDDSKVPPYYFICCRKAIHCKLRLNMSDLNNNLFNRHISDTKVCECGHNKEDAYHFLINCQRFTDIRAITINTLPPVIINIKNLQFGNEFFSLSCNSYVFHTVQEFITKSERFKKWSYLSLFSVVHTS